MNWTTAQSIAILFDLARQVNRAHEGGLDASDARNTLVVLAGVLGLTLETPEMPFVGAEPLIDLLMSTRTRLREAKQYQLADEIRDRLAELALPLRIPPRLRSGGARGSRVTLLTGEPSLSVCRTHSETFEAQ